MAAEGELGEKSAENGSFKHEDGHDLTLPNRGVE
jgi:hypothetical protein